MDEILTSFQIADRIKKSIFTTRVYFRRGHFKGAFKIGYSWRLRESDFHKWEENQKYR